MICDNCGWEEKECRCKGNEGSESAVDALVSCADCGTRTTKIWDNGDGKDRCEPCAVKKYKQSSVTMLWPKNDPLTKCSS